MVTNGPWPSATQLTAAALRRCMQRRYGEGRAVFLARAPGRVNLIGDHIDYLGLPVLPMAIQREVVLAFSPRSDDTVRVANLDAEYAPGSFRLHGEAEGGDARPHWLRYVEAAARAVANGESSGWDGMVAATLPAAAGLSSSSALSVAAALATLRSSGTARDEVELATLLAVAEREVGTDGGGMDQAICLGGRRRLAYRIDFDPLRLTGVPVPRQWCFVVASSGVRAEKSAAARDAYNARPRECRAALEALADVHDQARHGYGPLLAALPPAMLLERARAVLSAPLARRFRHVVTEATRVAAAESAMRASDLHTFGRLMVESHHSLRDDFEVSSAELDSLVEIALEAGAAGARLTGAGFGGCIVALCEPGSAQQVMAAIEERYYRQRAIFHPDTAHLFIAEPADGARVIELAD